VSLTLNHGVSLVDAIGAGLVLAGWSTVVVIARRRGWLAFPTPGRPASVAGRKLVVAGFVLLVEVAAAATVLAKPE
jgi:hypothetical protein